MLRMSSDSSIPSTMMRPASCFSSRLMHRMSVDLPGSGRADDHHHFLPADIQVDVP